MTKERLSFDGHVLLKGESQRKDGLYCYRWTDVNGVRKAFYANTLMELRIIEKRLQLIEQAGLIEYYCATVNDAYEVWCDLKHGIRENTMYNYKQVYNTHVRNSLGKRKILEIRPTDVKRFYYSLYDTKRLSFNTLDHIQTVLYQVLQLAVDDSVLTGNPAANALKDLKREKNYPKKDIEVLEIEQEKGFLEYCRNNASHAKWYPLFAVMLGSGMRVGEVCALQHKDIDFRRGVIHIRHSLSVSGAGCSILDPKTKSGYRDIPMLKSVRKALLMEIHRQKKNGIKCKVSIGEYSDFFFLNKLGNVQNQQSINRALQRTVMDYNCRCIESGENEKVIISGITSHTFRKTFITRMCESGMNVRDIMKIAGHSDIQTTMTVYTQVTDRMRRVDIDKLENYVDTEWKDQLIQ